MINPEQTAFFLDMDGTLLDIAPRPDAVVVAPGLLDDLRALRARCGGALAVVTGRTLAEVALLLGDAPAAVAAEHGSVLRLADGARIDPEPVTMPHALLPRAAAIVAAHPGALLECKSHGFVVHYRGVPDAGEAIGAALRAELLDWPGTRLLTAKMAWEVRPAGADKGSAVRALMAHPPFAGRVPVFVGDDVTDEDGMAVCVALGGFALRVEARFGDAAGVRAWVRQLGKGHVAAPDPLGREA